MCLRKRPPRRRSHRAPGAHKPEFRAARARANHAPTKRAGHAHTPRPSAGANGTTPSVFKRYHHVPSAIIPRAQNACAWGPAPVQGSKNRSCHWAPMRIPARVVRAWAVIVNHGYRAGSRTHMTVGRSALPEGAQPEHALDSCRRAVMGVTAARGAGSSARTGQGRQGPGQPRPPGALTTAHCPGAL